MRLVRPTFLVRLDTIIGPVVYQKYLTVIYFYHFYRYVQTFCLINEICRRNTLRPTLSTTFLPTPNVLCGPLLVYYFNIEYFAQMNARFWSYLWFQLLKARKLKINEKCLRKVIGHKSHSNFRPKSLKEVCLKATWTSKIVEWWQRANKIRFT